MIRCLATTDDELHGRMILQIEMGCSCYGVPWDYGLCSFVKRESFSSRGYRYFAKGTFLGKWTFREETDCPRRLSSENV